MPIDGSCQPADPTGGQTSPRPVLPIACETPAAGGREHSTTGGAGLDGAETIMRQLSNPAAANRPVRALCHAYRPEPLADVVDMIFDWDVADADEARRLAIRQTPGTPLLLIAPYRAPVRLERGGVPLADKCAMQVRDLPIVLRPTGPLGIIAVRIKPETAERITHAPPGLFGQAEVPLPHLFGRGEAATCDDLLASARTSFERVAAVEAFLMGRLRPASASLADRAAARLRRNPSLRVGDLAHQLDTSPRHLARTFHAAFAMSPKRFARLARVERVASARQRGLGWADVAQDCGLADQAHLIREFKAIVGARPAKFFPALPRRRAGARSTDVMSETFNLLAPPTDR